MSQVREANRVFFYYKHYKPESGKRVRKALLPARKMCAATLNNSGLTSSCRAAGTAECPPRIACKAGRLSAVGIQPKLDEHKAN